MGDGENSVYPPYGNITDDVGWWSIVFSDSADRFTFWRTPVKVDIWRSRTCICRVVGKPQLALIGSNRRLLYGNRRLGPRTYILD